ncbi:MAG: hypothetical protein BGP01_05360 [Paludibacter sp. 47-17]|nr:MAG: HAMP domain-containing histidine kinase [Paludibacter sp.]OJX90792.1 MAG: hypothetical protein BGP01_05360 [Paludibacter sp. 47-17]
MKLQARYLFVIKIAAIVLLALAGAWLMLKGLYFSAILVLVVIVSLAVSVYLDRRKLISRMERMISSIQNSDFSFHLPETTTKDELHNLSAEMEEALQAFRRQTQSSFMDEAETQAWQKLISVLTHEIMNSIAPIISLSETLSDTAEMPALPTEEEYKNMQQAMRIIHRRSKGLLSFVENYRKLTKIPEPVLQPIPLEPMLKYLQQLMTASGINLSYSVYPQPLTLTADKSLVEQALINLIKNASEAGSAEQETIIDIKANKIGNEIHIIVSDNGKGISPQAIEKIFIPFYTTKPTGSGIGLSICRQVMLRHKGKISVQSDEHGSRFTLTFPSYL